MKDNRNPITAIDSLLESDSNICENISVKPLTIGRYALLELVDSPFISSGKKFTMYNIIPTFYIMTSEFEDLKGYNSKNIDKLIEKAMELSEKLGIDQTQTIINSIFEKLGLLHKVSPNGCDEDSKTKKEEAQAETAS